MLAIKRRAALYTRVAFRDQGAMSSSVLSWTHHSAEGWHLLTHSHTLTIIIANNQVLDPSQILKSSVCAWAVFPCGSNTHTHTELLAATLLNLFLTGAECIHPPSIISLLHDWSIDSFYMVLGERPRSIAYTHKVNLNLQALSFLGWWFKLCLTLFFFNSSSF